MSNKGIAHGALATVIISSVFYLSTAQAQTITSPSGSVIQENKPREMPKIDAPGQLQIIKPNSDKNYSDAKIYVSRIEVDGIHSIDKNAINLLTQKFRNTTVTIGDVFRLSDEITQLYGDAGYALSFALVPVQDVKDGVVHIKVVEGIIGNVNVNVKGGGILVSKQRLSREIASAFNTLPKNKPVKVTDLEKAILRINDARHLKATIVVSASKTTENAADLTIEVEADRLSANYTFDNYIREEFGDYRHSFMVSSGNNFFAGDNLQISYRDSFKKEGFRYYDVGYDVPIFSKGLTANISYSNAKTEAQKGLLSTLDFAGSEEAVSASLEWSRVRTRKYSNFLSIGIDASDSESKLLDATLIHDKIRTLTFVSSWRYSPHNNSALYARLAYIQGLSGLGATDDNNPLKSRTVGNTDFSSVNVDLSWYSQILKSPYVASIDSSVQIGNGQGALASRECTIGGEYFGKAYYAGAIGGENCFKISGEISRTFVIKNNHFTPYVFTDFGYVNQSGDLDYEENRHDQITSYGLGMRFGLPFGISADLGAAWPSDSDYTYENKSHGKFIFKVGVGL